MIDLNEYVLRLDNLISNIQKLYKTSGPIENKTSKDILFQLNLLLEMHKDLHSCFYSKQVGVIAFNDTNLISGKDNLS